MTIEFAGEMSHPDPVEMSAGVLSVGRSSVVIGQLARASGRVAPPSTPRRCWSWPTTTAPRSMPQGLREACEEGLVRPKG